MLIDLLRLESGDFEVWHNEAVLFLDFLFDIGIIGTGFSGFMMDCLDSGFR